MKLFKLNEKIRLETKALSESPVVLVERAAVALAEKVEIGGF